MLNELTIVGKKVSNIEIITTLLGSMPKSYTSLIITQMDQVGTFHETLSLLLEEETKRNAKFYKGHSDDILGVRMLWKPKEARILKNFIDQPV